MGSKKERVFLLVVLLGSLLVAVGSGVGVYLMNGKTGELKTANDALDARITAAKSKLNKLSAMRVEREQAQSRLTVAESILPSQEEIESLVDNLSEFAKKSGIIIAKAEPVRQMVYRAPGGAAKKFEEASFDLDLEGDYFQFVEFINYLENYKRFIRVDDFAVTSGKIEGEPHTVDLKFATFTYVGAVSPSPSRVTPAKGAAK